eukprot:NODE_1288_length_920_cov_71.627995_g1242_i0.p1 GENE.NODE_1288_length_920_cov_71.627995_g1242_i0~~NODE_1288_length_920_cov_71.627995_g1242_i0.p1  ORF type:complete len:203 (+),score=29.01 NODE_1288_length_920_cov_71.627995_g1242_i0:111-719(+)
MSSAVDQKYLEGILDRVRQHDISRVNDIRSLKAEVEALQSELAKKNQIIKQLRAQVHTLADFKRNIVKSINPSPADVGYGEDDAAAAVLSSPRYGHSSAADMRPASPAAYDDTTAHVEIGPTSRAHPGAGPDIAGHEFFMQAKKQLSYQQFQMFLQVIKAFNTHEANKEQTLAASKEVFGAQHEDLYHAFHALLTRAQGPGL